MLQRQERVSVVASGPSGDLKTHSPLHLLSFSRACTGGPDVHRVIPYHALHLPGAAGAVPHKPRIVDVFIRHLGLVTVLVVQVVTLLALHQLVSH